MLLVSQTSTCALYWVIKDSNSSSLSCLSATLFYLYLVPPIFLLSSFCPYLFIQFLLPWLIFLLFSFSQFLNWRHTPIKLRNLQHAVVYLNNKTRTTEKNVSWQLPTHQVLANLCINPTKYSVNIAKIIWQIKIFYRLHVYSILIAVWKSTKSGWLPWR